MMNNSRIAFWNSIGAIILFFGGGSTLAAIPAIIALIFGIKGVKQKKLNKVQKIKSYLGIFIGIAYILQLLALIIILGF